MEDLAVKPFPPIFYQSVISHKFAVVLFFFTKKEKNFYDESKSDQNGI